MIRHLDVTLSEEIMILEPMLQRRVQVKRAVTQDASRLSLREGVLSGTSREMSGNM